MKEKIAMVDNLYKQAIGAKEQYKQRICKSNVKVTFMDNNEYKEICNENKRNAELGIATLVSLVDVCTANNTIAIVTVGPIAKNISDEVGLEPKRVAGIMDMFSCVFQGIIPYGAQLIYRHISFDYLLRIYPILCLSVELRLAHQ